MKTKILFIIVFFSFQRQFIFSQCTCIGKIQDYKENVKIKHSNLIFNDFIDTSTFNIQTYMAMYPALKIKRKRHVIDYYYYDNFLDGKPYIYARNKNFNLIKQIYKEANKLRLNEEERTYFIRNSLYFFLDDSCNNARNNVFPKDTEEGYIQYLYFYEFGELFALKWHANKKKKKVLCTTKDIEEFVKQLKDTTFLGIINENPDTITHYDTIILQNFLLREPFISILFDTDYVIIKWIELEYRTGIFERAYKIMRTSPYQIELIDEENLIKFQDIEIY